MVTSAKQYPVPFTLPSGQRVFLKKWTETDFEKLNMWVRKRYVAVMTELVQTFPASERHDFLSTALQEAVTLNYGFGKGQELVLGDTHGSAYAGYLLIDNPPITFEQFYDMVFGQASVANPNETGLRVLDAMSNAVYATDDGPIGEALSEIKGIIEQGVGESGEKQETSGVETVQA